MKQTIITILLYAIIDRIYKWKYLKIYIQVFIFALFHILFESSIWENVWISYTWYLSVNLSVEVPVIVLYNTFYFKFIANKQFLNKLWLVDEIFIWTDFFSGSDDSN